MVRDRLPELQQKLQETQTHNGNQKQYIQKNGKKGNTALGMDQLLAEVAGIRESIQELRSNVSVAKQGFQTALNCPFTDEGNKIKLDRVTEQIKSNSQDIRNTIKDLYTNYVNATSHGPTLHKTALAQHSSLLKEFLELMHLYQRSQVEYHDKLKAQSDLTAQIAGIDSIDNTIDSVFTENLLINSKEAQKSLVHVQERHDEILKLERSIQEVHAIFFEVALLVDAQGEMVNRIEDNVTDGIKTTTNATNTLFEAKQQKKKHRKRKIRLILAGAGVATATLLIMLL